MTDSPQPPPELDVGQDDDKPDLLALLRAVADFLEDVIDRRRMEQDPDDMVSRAGALRAVVQRVRGEEDNP